ncbi:uncharacterized protein LOC126896313 [Daktulosphaira vitifoliae]|uniref:uncharacterized protein LOC126896313 n=1 Tax=Daktulosphaira vitifoliae TaxID=58002 RepID=UPI0021AA6E90|nr:uncharacterized protein LOC126896313 [Daktulosphaira vitifoliae]
MFRLLVFLLTFILLICMATTSIENRIYRLPLIRRQSTLEKLLQNPDGKVKDMKIGKIKPTNENITLFKYLDSEFYSEVLVGKPGQKFKVIFDTTWGDMWLPSVLCSPKLYPFCEKKNLYDSSRSSTHVPIKPEPFNISGLVGNVTCDTVRLSHLNVTDLLFAEIIEVPNIIDFEVMKADGIIGLGYKTLAKTTEVPFFYKLIKDKKILKPIFSLYINRDPGTTKGGIIFLGGIEPKHINGTITYVPVIHQAYWQFEMTQFSVQINKTYSEPFCSPSVCQTVLDTSNNKIGVPAKYLLKLNTLIKAKEYKYNRYYVSCNTINKLPNIILHIGDRDFKLEPRHYIQRIETSNGLVCLTAFGETELDNDRWSLGGGFLSSVYTIFDIENNQIGFANLRSG